MEYLQRGLNSRIKVQENKRLTRKYLIFPGFLKNSLKLKSHKFFTKNSLLSFKNIQKHLEQLERMSRLSGAYFIFETRAN